jgi:pilus assembly protein CpaE
MTAVLNIIADELTSMTPSYLAFAADETSARTLKNAFSDAGFEANKIVVADTSAVIEQLEIMATPEILLVDLSKATDLMAEVEKLSTVCDPETDVLLIGSVNDLATYHALLDAGVADYMVAPVSPIEVTKALQRLRVPKSMPEKRPASADVDKQHGKVIGVVGVRGGVGASTLAANMAWIAAQEGSAEVVLIDFDLWFSAQALNFDIDPGTGLFDAVSEPDRIDELFVKRASVRVAEHLSVMACESDFNRSVQQSAKGFSSLTEHVRAAVDLVIIDVPRSALVSQSMDCSQIDTLVLVTDPTLIAMRDCGRLVRFLGEKVPDVELHVVLNKVGRAGKYELDEKTFSQGVGMTVSTKIPFDEKAILGCEAEGKCVAAMDARHKLAKSFSKIIHDLVDLGRQKPKLALSERILSLVGKNASQGVK